MTTSIELYEVDYDGTMQALEHKGSSYGIPTDLILTEHEDLFEAAEYGFVHWNTGQQDFRSMSVGDILNITDLEEGITFIVRCENAGWSAFTKQGWKEL